jgi:hypothetical protein
MSAGQAETGPANRSRERGFIGSVAEGEELKSNILLGTIGPPEGWAMPRSNERGVVPGLNWQDELEQRSALAVRCCGKLTAMTFNNHAANG